MFGPVAAGAVAFLLLAAWCFSLRRVDRALAVLGLYLGLLDSYLKLRTGNQAISLGRDVLIIAIAAGALLRSMGTGRPLSLPPLGALVLAFAAVVFIELFNPTSPGPVQGLAGVRQHLEFVPLFFLGYAFIRTERQVRMLVLILVICAAAGGVVSLIQSLITPAQLAQWGPGYRQRIAGVGAFQGAGRVAIDAAGNTVVRPFGLGPEIGSGAFIAALALPGLIALMITAPLKSRLVLTPLAIGVALAVATSGSRGATIMAFVSVVTFGAMAAVSKNALRATLGLAAGSALLFVVVAQLGPDNPAKNRAQSVAPSKVVSTFSRERLDSVTRFGDYARQYPLGVGVGSVGPATAITGQRTQVAFDSETLWNFLVIETGLAGLALILVLLFRFIWLAVTRIRRHADPAMRLYLAALAAPLFSLVILGFGAVTTIAVPFGPFLWLVTGVLSYWLVTKLAAPPSPSVRIVHEPEPPARHAALKVPS
jgi:hypothetical protein